MFLLFADAIEDVANDSGKKAIAGVLSAILLSVLTFIVGRYWGRYKAHHEWESKIFLHRVIVSLNIFADGFLKIRTVLERNLDDVFLNQIAVEKIEQAAAKCTADCPVMPIDPKDRWYLLNFVLNAVAEHFVDGHVRQDAGEKVAVVKYALFLTAELVGDERIRKIRAMLVKHDHLVNFPYPDTMPQLENPWHSDRVKTLRIAAELYKKEPDNFLVMEVCV